MQDEAGLDAAVSQCDLVVSLIPAPFHPPVAKAAIKHKKNMVTASYVSPAMAALHDAAVAAGIVVLNEAGLDPGGCYVFLSWVALDLSEYTRQWYMQASITCLR